MAEVSACRLRLAAAALLVAMTALAVAPPAAAQARVAGGVLAPPAPGMARIWIYREYEPFLTLARPYVRLNGAVAGISEPGSAFYRDVPAGTYAVTVDSDGRDVNQFVTLSAAPGQQIFVKVLNDPNWDTNGGGGGGDRGGSGYKRDTFYTWLIEPPAAAAEISRLPLYNGG